MAESKAAGIPQERRQGAKAPANPQFETVDELFADIATAAGEDPPQSWRDASRFYTPRSITDELARIAKRHKVGTGDLLMFLNLATRAAKDAPGLFDEHHEKIGDALNRSRRHAAKVGSILVEEGFLRRWEHKTKTPGGKCSTVVAYIVPRLDMGRSLWAWAPVPLRVTVKGTEYAVDRFIDANGLTVKPNPATTWTTGPRLGTEVTSSAPNVDNSAEEESARLGTQVTSEEAEDASLGNSGYNACNLSSHSLREGGEGKDISGASAPGVTPKKDPPRKPRRSRQRTSKAKPFHAEAAEVILHAEDAYERAHGQPYPYPAGRGKDSKGAAIKQVRPQIEQAAQAEGDPARFVRILKAAADIAFASEPYRRDRSRGPATFARNWTTWRTKGEDEVRAREARERAEAEREARAARERLDREKAEAAEAPPEEQEAARQAALRAKIRRARASKKAEVA